jgi:hypothetical protein
LLLVAALFFEKGGAVRAGDLKAAVDNAEIRVFDGSVFERASAKFGALGGAAFREEFGAQSSVQPGFRRQVKCISEDKPFAVALTDDRQKEAGLANFLSSRRGGIRQPDKWNAVEAKVGVDQGDALIETDAGVRCVELPGGMERVADGDPTATNEVNVTGEAFDFGCLEVERVLGNEDEGIGAALDFDGTADVGEGAVAVLTL